MRIKKIFLLALVVLLLLSFFLIMQFFQAAKTWEIIVSYNNQKQSLSLKKLKLLGEKIRLPDPLAQLSPYEVFVSDKQNKLLYKTPVHINEMLAYSLASKSSQLIPPLATSLDTVLYIPYEKSAAKIRLEKNGIGLLDISLTDQTSAIFTPMFPLPDTALAQTCGMEVVLLSDGYSNRNEFEQDAATITTAFATVEPYREVSDLLDFKLLYNTNPLGCATKGPRDCVLDNWQDILHTARKSHPNAAKVLVLAKSPPDGAVVQNGVLGTALIGGPISVIMKAPPALAFQYGQVLAKNAIHEFLGHSLGRLYDRYVFKTQSPPLSDTLSNCSPSPSGERFWQKVRNGPGFPGCLTPDYYAPYQNDCTANQNPNLASAGRSDTVMSATGCTRADADFDPVEQYYLKNTILPLLTKACPINAAHTPTPPQGAGPTLHLTATPPLQSTPSPAETAPPSSTQTPSSTVPYECHEETSSNPNNQIQMRMLVCTPKS